MTDETLLKTLFKWEAYLAPLQRTITPDLWSYYKEYGCLPPLPKEEELKTRLLMGGWDKELMMDDFTAGILSKEELFEAFDLFFDKDELQEKLDALCSICTFGSPTDEEWKLCDALMIYIDGSGLDD